MRGISAEGCATVSDGGRCTMGHNFHIVYIIIWHCDWESTEFSPLLSNVSALLPLACIPTYSLAPLPNPLGLDRQFCAKL